MIFLKNKENLNNIDKKHQQFMEKPCLLSIKTLEMFLFVLSRNDIIIIAIKVQRIQYELN